MVSDVNEGMHAVLVADLILRDDKAALGNVPCQTKKLSSALTPDLPVIDADMIAYAYRESGIYCSKCRFFRRVTERHRRGPR